MLKIPSRVTKKLMLTDSAFRQLVTLLNKTALECSNFNAELNPAQELRQKYEPTYQRLVELHNDETLTKFQRDDEALLCSGLSYSVDVINRVVICHYIRTMASKITKFTITLEHENGTLLQQASKNCDPEDQRAVQKLIGLYGTI